MQEMERTEIANQARATAALFAARATALRRTLKQMTLACSIEGTVGYQSRFTIWEKAKQLAHLANLIEQMGTQLLTAAEQLEQASNTAETLAELKAYLIFAEDQLHMEENDAENMLKLLRRSK